MASQIESMSSFPIHDFDLCSQDDPGSDHDASEKVAIVEADSSLALNNPCSSFHGPKTTCMLKHLEESSGSGLARLIGAENGYGLPMVWCTMSHAQNPASRAIFELHRRSHKQVKLHICFASAISSPKSISVHQSHTLRPAHFKLIGASNIDVEDNQLAHVIQFPEQRVPYARFLRISLHGRRNMRSREVCKHEVTDLRLEGIPISRPPVHVRHNRTPRKPRKSIFMRGTFLRTPKADANEERDVSPSTDDCNPACGNSGLQPASVDSSPGSASGSCSRKATFGTPMSVDRTPVLAMPREGHPWRLASAECSIYMTPGHVYQPAMASRDNHLESNSSNALDGSRRLHNNLLSPAITAAKRTLSAVPSTEAAVGMALSQPAKPPPPPPLPRRTQASESGSFAVISATRPAPPPPPPPPPRAAAAKGPHATCKLLSPSPGPVRGLNGGGQHGDVACPAPSKTMKRLFWQKLPCGQADDDSHTVWRDLANMSVDIDFSDLEAQFAAQERTTSNGQVKEGSSKSALETMFRSHAQGRAHLAEEAVSEEDIQRLASVYPSESEQKLLRALTRRPNSEEAFLLSLMDCPMLQQRLQAASCMQDIAARCTRLQRNVDALGEACKAVKQSELLKIAMSCTLKVGNFLNSGTHNAGAQAFDPADLLKLKSVKSTQGQPGCTTLLHFVARNIKFIMGKRGLLAPNADVGHKDNHEDVCGFSACQQLSMCQDAHALDAIQEELAAAAGQVSKLNQLAEAFAKCGPTHVRTVGSSLQAAADGARKQVNRLEADFTHHMDSFADLVTYLSGFPAGTKPSALFQLVYDFAGDLDQAWKDIETAEVSAAAVAARKLRTCSQAADTPVRKPVAQSRGHHLRASQSPGGLRLKRQAPLTDVRASGNHLRVAVSRSGHRLRQSGETSGAGKGSNTRRSAAWLPSHLLQASQNRPGSAYQVAHSPCEDASHQRHPAPCAAACAQQGGSAPHGLISTPLTGIDQESTAAESNASETPPPPDFGGSISTKISSHKIECSLPVPPSSEGASEALLSPALRTVQSAADSVTTPSWQHVQRADRTASLPAHRTPKAQIRPLNVSPSLSQASRVSPGLAARIKELDARVMASQGQNADGGTGSGNLRPVTAPQKQSTNQPTLLAAGLQQPVMHRPSSALLHGVLRSGNAALPAPKETGHRYQDAGSAISEVGSNTIASSSSQPMAEALHAPRAFQASRTGIGCYAMAGHDGRLPEKCFPARLAGPWQSPAGSVCDSCPSPDKQLAPLPAHALSRLPQHWKPRAFGKRTGTDQPSPNSTSDTKDLQSLLARARKVVNAPIPASPLRK